MNIYREAREFVQSALGIEVSDLSDEKIKFCVEGFYPGGWEGLVESCREIERLARPATPRTPFQIFAEIVRNLTPIVDGRKRTDLLRLKLYEEVVSAQLEDGKAVVLIRTAKLDERSRRDRVTYGMRLMQWTRTESGEWAFDMLEVPTTDAREYSRYGYVNDILRAASQREQYEICYRPGTHKSPMQGPAARLQITADEWSEML